MFKNLKLKLNPTAHVVLLLIVLIVIGVFVYQTWAQNSENQPIVTEKKREAAEAEDANRDQKAPKQFKTASSADTEDQNEVPEEEQETQGQIQGIIKELQQNVTSLAGKVEPYYNEIKSLLIGSEEKIAELNERVDKLEERIAHLEFLHTVSIKLFEATPCTQSANFPRNIPEWKFKETTAELEIKEGDRAIISSTSEGSGDFVYDNDLYINGTNVGPGFAGFNGPVGAPAEVAWRPVPPKDVTPFIPTGKTNVTFELRDNGAWHGNTDIYLTIFREK